MNTPTDNRDFFKVDCMEPLLPPHADMSREEVLPFFWLKLFSLVILKATAVKFQVHRWYILF